MTDEWIPTHQHYKGGYYRELHRATHSETEEALVVYQTPDGRVWVRPAAMFDEVIEVPASPAQTPGSGSNAAVVVQPSRAVRRFRPLGAADLHAFRGTRLG